MKPQILSGPAVFVFPGCGCGVAAPVLSYNPGDPFDWYRVDKIRYMGKGGVDKTWIIYNEHITISGIPEEAQDYLLGSRSGLDWILERYQVKTDKASGIINDPNDWVREVGNPRYILDLIQQVTTVSVCTMEIVKSLPPLAVGD